MTKNPYIRPGIISAPEYVVPQVLQIEFQKMFEGQKHKPAEARQILFYIESLSGQNNREICEKYNMPRQTVTSAILRMKQLLYYYNNLRLKVATIATKCNLIEEYTRSLNLILKN